MRLFVISSRDLFDHGLDQVMDAPMGGLTLDQRVMTELTDCLRFPHGRRFKQRTGDDLKVGDVISCILIQ
jgi:hypothetical protein